MVDEDGAHPRSLAGADALAQPAGGRGRDRPGGRALRRGTRSRPSASAPRAGWTTTKRWSGSPRTWPGGPNRCKARLSGRIELPLIVDNDANAAAWAEYRFGAGRGSSVMVCITLGTGIGGGLVIGGSCSAGRTGWPANGAT